MKILRMSIAGLGSIRRATTPSHFPLEGAWQVKETLLPVVGFEPTVLRKHRGRAAKFQDVNGVWQYHRTKNYVFYGDEGAYHLADEEDPCYRQKDVADSDSVMKDRHMDVKMDREPDIQPTEESEDQEDDGQEDKSQEGDGQRYDGQGQAGQPKQDQYTMSGAVMKGESTKSRTSELFKSIHDRDTNFVKEDTKSSPHVNYGMPNSLRLNPLAFHPRSQVSPQGKFGNQSPFQSQPSEFQSPPTDFFQSQPSGFQSQPTEFQSQVGPQSQFQSHTVQIPMEYHPRSQAQNRFQIDSRGQIRSSFFEHERYRLFEYRRSQFGHENRSKKRQRITEYADLDSEYSDDLEEPQPEFPRFLAAAQIYRKNSISLATHVALLMRELSKRRKPLIELEARLLQNLKSAYTEWRKDFMTTDEDLEDDLTLLKEQRS